MLLLFLTKQVALIFHLFAYLHIKIHINKEIEMTKKRTFGGVTQAVWSCVKRTSEQEHSTVYEPADALQGTATTDSVVGKVVLGFNYMPDKESIQYTIIKKPMLVPTSAIWDGIQESIEHCQHH